MPQPFDKHILFLTIQNTLFPANPILQPLNRAYKIPHKVSRQPFTKLITHHRQIFLLSQVIRIPELNIYIKTFLRRQTLGILIKFDKIPHCLAIFQLKELHLSIQHRSLKSIHDLRPFPIRN
jgi:hypothetical protein